MRKHMKKIIAAALVLLLVGGFVYRDGLIRMYVRLNNGALEDFALTLLENRREQVRFDRYGPWDATAWEKKDVVEFYVQRSFAFGGVEKGFYYSADDNPVSFHAVTTPLVETDGRWRWEEGGNHGYTLRIRPRWFWFEAVL